MTNRSRAREVALQLLFQRDQNKVLVARHDIENFARERLRQPESIAFCLAVYDGVLTNLPAIDKLLTATAENWRLTRMMPADRNVLRIGTWELLQAPDPAPPAVVIDEAIELARRFGTADSGAFVNGILDKIAQSRTSEQAASAPESG